MRRAMAGVTAVLVLSALGLARGEDPSLRELLIEKGVLNKADVAGLAKPAAPGYPTVQVGGRMMLDAAVYDSDDADFHNATEFRRARLFAKGKLADDWSYKLQYDFTGSGNEGLRDLYLAYFGLGDRTTLRLGHYTEPGSLEDSMSSRYLTFMERALPILAFEPAVRRIGFGGETFGAGWAAQAGVFTEGAAADETEDDGLGATARFVVNPTWDKQRFVHLGVWGGYRESRGDEVLRFRARPESHVDDTRLVDTGVMSNATARVSYGAEAAGVVGPFSLQGEYLATEVDRDGGGSLQYDGFYVQGSFFLTGESRAYDRESGLFTRVKPKRPAGEGGVGAWEVAARFSTLDLNDDVRGGEEDNVTLGLNWYVNNYVRFMLNYVRASADTDTGDVDADIYMTRAQFDF